MSVETTELRSCLYEGIVRHERFTPVSHAFHYRVFFAYLDLSELDRVFQGRWLWSTGRPSLAWFRREDHFGDPTATLDETVRNLVEKRTGSRPAGPIRLLTNLRYFGYVINPISVYYCFSADETSLDTIVAEVTNTPWGERHCYVVEVPGTGGETAIAAERARSEKQLHVSPFMPMDMSYQWTIGRPGDSLALRIENLQGTRKPFQASMQLKRREITGRQLASTLLRYPCMTAQVFLGIHWQAWKLWRKKVPVHPHPGRSKSTAAIQKYDP